MGKWKIQIFYKQLFEWRKKIKNLRFTASRVEHGKFPFVLLLQQLFSFEKLLPPVGTVGPLTAPLGCTKALSFTPLQE